MQIEILVINRKWVSRGYGKDFLLLDHRQEIFVDDKFTVKNNLSKEKNNVMQMSMLPRKPRPI
jgi:hypothetical protein